MAPRKFWHTTALADMTPEQFESICDGCGRCCVHKLEDEDNGHIVFTDVACRLLDTDTCRCTDYAHRTERVAGCVKLHPHDLAALAFVPNSCAYRRLDEGRGLASWHPLIAGDDRPMVKRGISMAGQLVSETHIHPDDIPTRQRPDMEWSAREK